MKRINREKRNIGGATRRTRPSYAAKLLQEKGLVVGKALDFGCGFGFDADHYGWDAYDPFYRPWVVTGPYDTIVCVNVLNAIIRKRRREAMEDIQKVLSDKGIAYLSVARNIPEKGKICDMKRAQHYVVLDLPTVYRDKRVEIYALRKGDVWTDSTKDCIVI